MLLPIAASREIHYADLHSGHVNREGGGTLTCATSAGIPQGSILGPVLFLMFIDDLASQLEKDIQLFANDSTLHIAIRNTFDRIICSESLQCDLNKIEALADSWCVTFNASKTEEMIISRKRSQNHPPLHFMNKELQPTNGITRLGVTITKTLSWS